MLMFPSYMMVTNRVLLFIQSKIESRTNWEFGVRLSHVYTRAVYSKWEETLSKASAYKISVDSERGEHCWLVQHTKRSEKIVWGQHQFQVKVNQETGEFTCECKAWEHTGMTKIHIVVLGTSMKTCLPCGTNLSL